MSHEGSLGNKRRLIISVPGGLDISVSAFGQHQVASSTFQFQCTPSSQNGPPPQIPLIPEQSETARAFRIIFVCLSPFLTRNKNLCQKLPPSSRPPVESMSQNLLTWPPMPARGAGKVLGREDLDQSWFISWDCTHCHYADWGQKSKEGGIVCWIDS